MGTQRADSTGDSLENKAAELLRLHQDPTLLTVVNVWDSISAKVVADTPGHRRPRHREPLDRRGLRATRTARRSRSD